MTRRTMLAVMVALLAACGPAPAATPTRTAAPAPTTPAPPIATATRRAPSPTPVPATPAPPTPTATPVERGQRVIFPAPDGVRIRGAFYIPTGAPPYKTVILVPPSGGGRHQWDAFIPVLQGAGYAVLDYDLRGTGESDPVPLDDAYLDSLPLDVAGALDWLGTRAEVDPQHIGVIGVSLGANVAYAANGVQTRLRTAVLLSPTDTGEALQGTGVAGFVSRNVLFVSDEAGAPIADALYAQTLAPRKQVTIPGAGASGVALLGVPDAVNEILAWLAERL